MIENKHLRSFLRVLDLGGFSRAARSLHIAQPALSQHVRRLEDHLGVTLLERSVQGVTPTPAGRQFAKRARQILELVDLAEREFDAGPQAIFGEVSLGLPGSVCPVLAAPLITEAARRFPNIRLLVTELMSGDLADLLREGRMDAAMLFNVAETDDFTSTPLVEELLHLAGAPGDARLAPGRIAAGDLAALPLIGTRPPHGLRLLVERWSNEHDLPLTFAVEADSPTVLVEMAAQGLGHSILSHSAVRRIVEAGLLATAEITDPPIRRTACLCLSKRLPPDPARDAIQQLTQQVAQQVVDSGDWRGRWLPAPPT